MCFSVSEHQKNLYRQSQGVVQNNTSVETSACSFQAGCYVSSDTLDRHWNCVLGSVYMTCGINVVKDWHGRYCPSLKFPSSIPTLDTIVLRLLEGYMHSLCQNIKIKTINTYIYYINQIYICYIEIPRYPHIHWNVYIHLYTLCIISYIYTHIYINYTLSFQI